MYPGQHPPDRIAYRMADSAEAITYGELEAASNQAAHLYRERGLTPGDGIAILLGNEPDYLKIVWGAQRSGLYFTPISVLFSAAEIEYIVDNSDAKLLITRTAFADGIDLTAFDADVLLLDGDDPATNWFGQAGTQPTEPIADETEGAEMVYSSGTTGLPKGVMLTHRNLVANIEQCQHAIRYTDDEVALAALPFFHIYGMQVLMNGMLTNGVTVLTMARFDMEQALQLVAEHKVTRFFAVPPMVLGLAKAPIVDQYDLSSVKQVFSGAAPLTVELQNECAERINCEVVQGFGMTELSPVTHCTPEGRNKPGTSGVAVSNVESRIVDPETGQDQPVGERGELWVRGPMVMKGYLNNPEATADTIDEDGWLHTGDVAIVDEDGYFSIVDRIKELIKYNGFQVPPAELEGLIATHPKVLDVAVIGIPDEAAGELPKAFVQLAPDVDLTLEELQEFVGDHLVSYKQIRLMEVIDLIPKSASGKILRRELRDR